MLKLENCQKFDSVFPTPTFGQASGVWTSRSSTSFLYSRRFWFLDQLIINFLSTIQGTSDLFFAYLINEHIL